jgi:sec-independent protein translocase protein TatA
MGASLLSPVHLGLLLVVALLLFGAKRLPEIGRSLGSGMREFKDSVSGLGGEHPVGGEPERALPLAVEPISTAPIAPLSDRVV